MLHTLLRQATLNKAEVQNQQALKVTETSYKIHSDVQFITQKLYKEFGH